MNSKNYFNRVAGEWDEMRKGFFSDRVREAALEKAGVLSGKSATDIGAGTGFITAWAMQRKFLFKTEKWITYLQICASTMFTHQ